MRPINRIVVHCAATKPNQDIGVHEIEQWHQARGWTTTGYHLVIRRNGIIEYGRDWTRAGAHVAGHNEDSLGICLVGGVSKTNEPEDNFTDEQYASLIYTKAFLDRMWPDAEWLGHRDFPGVNKACPSFSVREWIAAEKVL